MASKTPITTLFSLFFITLNFSFLFSLSTTPTQLQSQTLHVTSLPKPQPLHQSLLSSSTLHPPTPNNSLSFQLHHVDSLPSSFNSTPQQLLRLRLLRDATRVSSITSLVSKRTTASPGFSSSVISGMSQGSGEYFTRIGVGTPPKYVYMIMDTGSDVVWIQCSPCDKCYAQTDPVFNPSDSSSFSFIPCGSPLCRGLQTHGCNTKKRLCLYEVSYGDGSFTVGEFSTETLTFRGTRINHVALGCGHDNEGLFIGAAGLLGLGRGRISFLSQAGSRFNNRFSYCLVDRSTSSKPSFMLFGDSSVSRTARFTPLLTNVKLNTFYYVSLLGISVGGTRVPGITPSLFKLRPSGTGGVMIDSGTAVTRLTRPAYIALRDAFRTGASHLKRAPDYSLFDTCYDLSSKTEVEVPTVVLHFRGADMALPASNYLIPVDAGGSFCFAFAGTMSGLNIIGNIQQQGFRVVFDLAKSRVGFSPRGC